MKMNSVTSIALRICLFAGIVVLAIGLLVSGTEYGTEILWIGVLILIMSPFVGVLVAYAYLLAEKDWKWVKVATVLIAFIAVFLIFSLLKN
ncbi:MAG: hypothetical protein FWC44_02740 [Methanomassiliicoccaceae archaeon]|nr:hypothetical protein [Methanomassiliicoccaceae archaeon]MCL2317960.1 hypothetical protein [Methanomassiliicoccaceae archaeon]